MKSFNRSEFVAVIIIIVLIISTGYFAYLSYQSISWIQDLQTQILSLSSSLNDCNVKEVTCQTFLLNFMINLENCTNDLNSCRYSLSSYKTSYGRCINLLNANFEEYNQKIEVYTKECNEAIAKCNARRKQEQ
jgi:hypothetical protein